MALQQNVNFEQGDDEPVRFGECDVGEWPPNKNKISSALHALNMPLRVDGYAKRGKTTHHVEIDEWDGTDREEIDEIPHKQVSNDWNGMDDGTSHW